MKDFVFCVDSDGCAMDTMTVKHESFFGPLAADFFKIQDREDFLEKWNEVNLYSKTRGINRFKGLAIALKYDEEKTGISKNLERLYDFVDNSDVLSNDSLEKELQKNYDEGLDTALKWSKEVNVSIERELTGNDKPFENVLKSLKLISQKADIAIVSSANTSAIKSEWQRHGLLDYVNYIFGQEDGTKEFAISEVIKKGYKKENVIMVGDALGDEKAAFNNGVKFYPIVIRKEAESWENLAQVVLEDFILGNFDENYQNELLQEFHDVLN